MRYHKLSFLMLFGLSTPVLATFPNLESMLDAFEPVAPTAPVINQLIISLDALSGQVRSDAVQTLIPLADGSLRAASDGAMRQMLSVISDRVKQLPPENKCNPCILPPPNNGAWGQLLGNYFDQEDRDGIPGYNGYMIGGIIGRDLKVCPTFYAGVAAGYQFAKADSFGPSGSYLDIHRVHGTAYARYQPLNVPFYSVGVLTLARNQYDSHRFIYVPNFNRIAFSRVANGDFAAWETNVYFEEGFDCKKNNLHIIPKVMLTYSHLNPESYIEEDANGLNLNIKYESFDFFDMGAGLQIEYHNLFPKAWVNPEIHGNVFYDFMQDRQTATANFLGGGYAFLTEGAEQPRVTYEVGVGMAVHSYKETSVKFQYDYVARTDYHRHQAFIKLRHEWG